MRAVAQCAPLKVTIHGRSSNCADSSIGPAIASACIARIFPDRPTWYSRDAGQRSSSTAASGTATTANGGRARQKPTPITGKRKSRKIWRATCVCKMSYLNKPGACLSFGSVSFANKRRSRLTRPRAAPGAPSKPPLYCRHTNPNGRFR